MATRRDVAAPGRARAASLGRRQQRRVGGLRRGLGRPDQSGGARASTDPVPAVTDPRTAHLDGLSGPVDRLHGPILGFCFLFIFFMINGGRYKIASVNTQLIEAPVPRQMRYPPLKIFFFCSSANYVLTEVTLVFLVY